MNKQNLRNWIREERKKLDFEILCKEFVRLIRETEEYSNAQNVMIFYPKKYEINLLGLLEDEAKNFYLPKIDNDNLLCCPFRDEEELCESCFKTKEPLTDAVSKNIIDLVIVPALAVDKNNYRLGYGGGYYDRFLSDLKCKTLTCVPQVFYLETVYPDNFDVKVDKIIYI